MTFTFDLFQNTSIITVHLECAPNLYFSIHGCVKLKIWQIMCRFVKEKDELRRPTVVASKCILIFILCSNLHYIIHIQICIYVCIFIYAYVYIHIYICVCIYIYIVQYNNIHIYILLNSSLAQFSDFVSAIALVCLYFYFNRNFAQVITRSSVSSVISFD